MATQGGAALGSLSPFGLNELLGKVRRVRLLPNLSLNSSAGASLCVLNRKQLETQLHKNTHVRTIKNTALLTYGVFDVLIHGGSHV